jgi:hypothetical protein
MDKEGLRQQSWVNGKVNYCMRNGIHLSELGVSTHKYYALLIEKYNERVKAFHFRQEVEKSVTYRSTSVDNIKDRTGGRNRKEHRGS